MPNIQIKQVENEYELDHCLFIRKIVFVNEQGVPLADEYDEWDNYSAGIPHIIAYDGEQPVGTARLREVDGIAKLERICVVDTHRKYGIGQMLVQKLEEMSKSHGLTRAKLHGQTQARGFYERLGYTADSDEFLEDGIPHIRMIKELQ
nr:MULTISPECIES: GNAT family N-acetyltransferase [Paenibacillus]